MHSANSGDPNRAETDFLNRFPDYSQTTGLDDLRKADFRRLDEIGEAFLDYTGSGLYAARQLMRHSELLAGHVFGNPHSSNATSQPITDLIEKTRRHILDYFRAPLDEYLVIFTANASGALKLVGEAYPFQRGGTFLLTYDNHNSVNGIREFARARGADVVYTPVLPPDMRIADDALSEQLRKPVVEGKARLLAYPAQSNFSGVLHSLEWITRAKEAGWDVLLDAAAFVSTHALDIGAWKPDFVPVSFYKLFGYPTGVGCLIARREALRKMHRPWFAGGTITVASVQEDRYFLAEGSEAFEDGTLNFLSIPAVEYGLDLLESIGLEHIQTRADCLAAWVLEECGRLRHANGAPLVRIYGPSDCEGRGATITFNLYDYDGRFFDHHLVERKANQHRISLRTGCFCNPGGGETALGISKEELHACFLPHQDRMTTHEFRRCIDSKSSGAVRISLGMVSNFRDVFRLLALLREFLDRSTEELR